MILVNVFDGVTRYSTDTLLNIQVIGRKRDLERGTVWDYWVVLMVVESVGRHLISIVRNSSR